MKKPYLYKKTIFSILILLSSSGSVQIITRNNIDEFQKLILICLNFLYLFMVSEYIETIMYYNILQNIFEYKNFSSSIIYKLFFGIIPIFSLFIYVLAWTVFSINFSDSEKAFAILILMGISYFVIMIQIRYSIVFVNKDHLFIYKKIIPFEAIKSHSILIKSGIGIKVNEIKIVLDSGDEYSFRITIENTDEFIGKLNN